MSSRSIKSEETESKLHHFAKSERNLFDDGYPTHIFLEPSDVIAFTCSICHKVFKNPITTSPCSHTFCEKCYEENAKIGNLCPSCNNTVLSSEKNAFINSKILLLRVKCPHKLSKDSDCTWEGRLEDLSPHLEICHIKPQHMESKEGYPLIIFTNKNISSSYTCNKCGKVMRQSVMIAECGHFYCKLCAPNHVEESDIKIKTDSKESKEEKKEEKDSARVCPKCRKAYTQCIQLQQIDVLISNEPIKCSAHPKCAWTGIASQWDDHKLICTSSSIETKDAKDYNARLDAVANLFPSEEKKISEERKNEGVEQNNPQPSRSRHPVLDKTDICCELFEKLIKMICWPLLNILITFLMWLCVIAATGWVIPIREPAFIMGFVLMGNSISSGWMIFLGTVVPTALMLFYDAWLLVQNLRSRADPKPADSWTMKYIIYYAAIGNNNTFAAYSQQKKEEVTDVFNHFYWRFLKTGVYILSMVWLATADGNAPVNYLPELKAAGWGVIGTNILIDLLDYFMTFRRIRELHRLHNL